MDGLRCAHKLTERRQTNTKQENESQNKLKQTKQDDVEWKHVLNVFKNTNIQACCDMGINGPILFA